jgi:hypothetical protein
MLLLVLKRSRKFKKLSGSQTAEEISKILLSNHAVHRRLTEMFTFFENYVLANLQPNKHLLSNCMKVLNYARKLNIFVRFVEGLQIIEQFLFCRY